LSRPIGVASDAGRESVLTAIDLHDQVMSEADEIDHKAADWCLSFELESV
jgi:hypothetical protein